MFFSFLFVLETMFFPSVFLSLFPEEEVMDCLFQARGIRKRGLSSSIGALMLADLLLAILGDRTVQGSDMKKWYETGVFG